MARATERNGVWKVERLLAGATISCIAADRASSTVYAGAWGNGILRSTDGGATWTPNGLEGERVTGLAARDGVVVAGTKGPLLFRSGDGGATWDEMVGLRRLRRWYWGTPVAKPHRDAHAQAISISPTDPHVMLVGIEAGAVVRTTDGGRTWEGHRRGAIRDAHTVHFHAERGEYAYEGGGWGAAFSRDGGRTWTRATRGLGRARYCWAAAGDVDDPEVRYVSSARGPRAAHGAYRHAWISRARAGEPWHPVLELDAMPYALIPASAGVYAGLSDGRVLESRDGGDSWSALPFRLPSIERTLVLLP